MWTRRALLASGAALTAATLLPRRSFAATDQLRVALVAEPPHLDPTLDPSPATMQVSYQNIFEGLTRLDEHGTPQPGLARSWTVSPDGLAYAFALQPMVRFHDGTAFDAQHVIFSLNRLLDPNAGNPQRGLFQNIASVTAPDEASVNFVLKTKDDAFLFNLGRAEASMVAPESADNNRTVPIGTGPFALVQWDGGQRIALERNEDYWGVHPRISEATFVFLPDPTAAISAMSGKQIDAYPAFPAPDALGPLRSDPAVKIITGIGPDKKLRIGLWNAELTGMWVNAPVESCALAGLRWAGDTGSSQVGPTPQITSEDD
ncbi:MAG TPA: ABC transporter substrate-binding protein [Devosiaceae bacterium]|nr:ABC transporter substrate-binding protein [Devosiaceae bacterium]